MPGALPIPIVPEDSIWETNEVRSCHLLRHRLGAYIFGGHHTCLTSILPSSPNLEALAFIDKIGRGSARFHRASFTFHRMVKNRRVCQN